MTVQVWQSNVTGEKIYTVCEIESPYYTYVGTEEWPDPPSGSSGGGAESYNMLTDQPMINGNKLIGNKTTEQLGIKTYDDTSIREQIAGVEKKGVPEGGTEGQIMAKRSGANYDTEWVDPPEGGSGVADSVAWSKVTGKPSNLVQDASYVHTDNNYTNADKTAVSELSTTLSGKANASDMATALAGKADKADLPENVSDLENDAEYQTAAEVTAAIAAEVAKIVAGADADFDTLKEIADWITNHADDAAAMNSAIAALQTALGGHSVGTDVPSDAVFTDTVYKLPQASGVTLGGIMLGNGFRKDANGVVHVDSPSETGYVDSTHIVDYNTETHALERWDSTDATNKEQIVLPDWSGEIGALAKYNAKNLLPNTAIGKTVTSNGVTFTVNADGSVTINGKNTATAANQCYIELGRRTLKAGKYIISPVPEGYANKLWVWGANVGENRTESEQEVTLAADRTTNFGITIAVGDTEFNNVTVYPMIRDAAITDDTYVPYGMTNAEITEALSDTGWQDVTASFDGTMAHSKARRKNGIVQYTFAMTKNNTAITKGTWVTLATLPERFRPTLQTQVSVTVRGANNTWTGYGTVRVEPEGEVSMMLGTDYAIGAITSLAFTVTILP